MDTDSDLEDIDLESTEVSDQDADKEYDVEKILASKFVNGEERYLVMWRGYPIERSTWEPERSFNNPTTVSDWKKTESRQKKGLEPEFDWQEWDRQRAEDERKTQEGRRKRQIKRRRLGWVRPDESESELEGFVVADDEVSSEQEAESSSGSEPDTPEQVRKRKKDSVSAGSGDASDDSLMEAVRRKQLRKKRLKSRRKSGNASQGGSPPGSPKATTAESKGDRVRLEKRKRSGSPSEILSGAARNLSLESGKQGKKKLSGVDRHPKKQKLQGPINIVAKPLRPGPSRPKQRRASDNLVAPGQVRTFTSLSRVNRVNKAGKNEPPPDPSQLELFAPGQPGRALPPIMALPRRASLSHVNSELTGSSMERPTSPVKVNKSIPYASFKIPKRKPTIPAAGAPQALHSVAHDEEIHKGFSPGIAYGRGNDIAWEESRDSRGLPLHQDAMDLDIPQMVSPGHLMDIDNSKPADPRAFVCNLEQGPQATFVGEAKLTGFSTSFVVDLYNKPECRSLWISKFYGQNYLKEYFAPHYGPPLHTATVEIDPNQVQPLVNALAFLKGAGIVLHPDFTMLMFLPSNHDLDRQAFKLPQLPATGPSKIKPALRVVVYPPLEGIGIPSRDSNPEAHSREITTAVETLKTLPWWEQHLQYSLPAYLSSTVGCNWDEVLEVERETIDKAKGKEVKETLFVLVYPLVAEAESEEYQHALQCLKRKVVDLKFLRNSSQAQGYQSRYTFLIHQSLRRQLHLLPDLFRDRKKEARSYWLYGARFENNKVIEEKPQKIWASGSIVFITPQLIASGPEAFKDFLSYAERKAATTKLALPSVWEEKVMEVMQKEPNENVLNFVLNLKEKIEHGSIILIQVYLYKDCNELEVYIDEFALYQLDNPFQFRRYWFGHPTLPDPAALELFKNIEFYTPESLKTQLETELRRTQTFQDHRKAHAHPTPSGTAIRRDLLQGAERRS